MATRSLSPALHRYEPVRERGTLRAFGLAVLTHLLLITFLYFGVQWQSSTPRGEEAELWDEAAVQQAVQTAPPPPEVKPEPVIKAPPTKVEEEADIALEQKRKREREAAAAAAAAREAELARRAAEDRAEAQRQAQLKVQKEQQARQAELQRKAQAEQQAKEHHRDGLEHRTRRQHDGGDEAQRHQRAVVGRAELLRHARERLGEQDDDDRADRTGEERTERRDAEARLNYQAHFDAPTGLPNQVLLRDRLGVSFVELGFALTVFNVLSGVVQAPMGFAADRLGPRRITRPRGAGGPAGGRLPGARAGRQRDRRRRPVAVQFRRQRRGCLGGAGRGLEVRRTRPAGLHLGHHWPTQGIDDLAPQRDLAVAQCRRLHPDPAQRRAARLPAALPHRRAHLHDLPAAALRRGR
mgnify:CR=1 FL=1